MAKEGSTLVRAGQRESDARSRLLDLFRQTPIPGNELLRNLPVYLRANMLAKILYADELYDRILPIPGVIMEFGVWWGSNLALLANLRHVKEPYNWTRKVIGFDTFSGYAGRTDKDGDSLWAETGAYAVSENYEHHLTSVLDCHQADNILPEIVRHEIVKGDVMVTVDEYFRRNPQTIVALACFDLALYEPTKKCLEAIRPHLVKGSVIAMDELNQQEFPGETIAFRDVIGLDRFRLFRSRYWPDRSFAVVE